MQRLLTLTHRGERRLAGATGEMHKPLLGNCLSCRVSRLVVPPFIRRGALDRRA
jgi:hypothetical protein